MKKQKQKEKLVRRVYYIKPEHNAEIQKSARKSGVTESKIVRIFFDKVLDFYKPNETTNTFYNLLDM